MRSLIPFCLLLLLASCRNQPLTLYTEYITPEWRASYHVVTPDPRWNCPDLGQRLYLKWKLPKEWQNCGELRIHLVLRYRNREQVEQWIPIQGNRGMKIFELYNDEYFRTGGILTFKADLYSGDALLHEWRHQIWVEWIEIEETDAN